MRPANVVRAKRFELLNDGGEPISIWGIDKWGQTVLAFGSPSPEHISESTGKLDLLNSQRAAIGLLGDGSPFMSFRAKDGQPRARLYLNEFAKPALLMDDETGVRLALGIEQSDTPSANDNDWVLNFYPERARMGMFTERDATGTYVRGFLAVHKEKVKYPRSAGIP